MPSISFGGINTGLPPNLVDQLVEAEKIPIKNIEQKKTKEQNRLTLVNELEEKLRKIEGSIATLASTRGFTDIKLVSGDPNIVQGVVDPEASVNGSWNVEIIELAQKAAAITNGFPDKDKTEVGVGYFEFDTPDGHKEVYLGSENNTLQDAANAINAANVGVRATVINDRSDPDNPFRLMITGNNVGGDNRIQYPTLYFLDGDQDIYFDEERDAKNGRVKIDGIEFEIAENELKDLIPGVTLDLKQAAPGRTVNVSVKEDQEVVSGKIKEFVDATNAVFSFIQSQNSLNEHSDTSSTLGGDGLLRSVENRLRRLIQSSQFGLGGIQRLGQLGIEFSRNGTLNFNEDKFNSTLAKSPGDVQRFFAGDGFATGFIPSLKRELNAVLDSAFGPIAIRRKALQDKIGRMDDQIANKERQVQRREETLRRQFSKLEETMSRLKSQGNALGAMGGGGMAGLNLKG